MRAAHARDEFVQARVQIFPFAYSFRAGSRIRLTIEAPGGDRPLWTFDTPADDTAQVVNRIAPRRGRTRPGSCSRSCPSGPDLGAAPAPCPSLRAAAVPHRTSRPPRP